MARKKKEVSEETFDLDENLKEVSEEEETHEEIRAVDLEEVPEKTKAESFESGLEGIVKRIDDSSILISYMVNGVESGIIIPMEEKHKEAKPGSLIRF